jgi:transposase InsO family protein
LGIYSLIVFGWAVSDQMKADIVERAFLAGRQRRGKAVNPLVHSECGSQYVSSNFRHRLSAWDWQQSMSGKATCWDNAVAESFFSVLKEELVYQE